MKEKWRLVRHSRDLIQRNEIVILNIRKRSRHNKFAENLKLLCCGHFQTKFIMNSIVVVNEIHICIKNKLSEVGSVESILSNSIWKNVIITIIRIIFYYEICEIDFQYLS